MFFAKSAKPVINPFCKIRIISITTRNFWRVVNLKKTVNNTPVLYKLLVGKDLPNSLSNKPLIWSPSDNALIEATDITIEDITTTGDLTVGGDATITGDISADNGTISGDLGVTGDATIGGDITVTGDLSAGDAELDSLNVAYNDPQFLEGRQPKKKSARRK